MPYIINVLLLVVFAADRLFSLKSFKEFKDAKEAQVANLKMQLELEKRNNDLELADMHKKRYDNLKLILDDKEAQKMELIEGLLFDLNDLARKNHVLETEKKMHLTVLQDQ